MYYVLKTGNIKEKFNKLKEEYKNLEEYESFFKYVEKTWIKPLTDGTLNYADIDDQRYRSNSVLEGFNGRLKSYFPNRKANFYWSDFILILHKLYEDLYQSITSASNLRTQSPPQSQNLKEENKNENISTTTQSATQINYSSTATNTDWDDLSNLLASRLAKQGKKKMTTDKVEATNRVRRLRANELQWIKWANNSCRFDAFFTLITLAIYNEDRNSLEKYRDIPIISDLLDIALSRGWRGMAPSSGKPGRHPHGNWEFHVWMPFWHVEVLDPTCQKWHPHVELPVPVWILSWLSRGWRHSAPSSRKRYTINALNQDTNYAYSKFC
ncbi:unnamed protein product [Blepharisma stoltei]|uniref:Transposase n=1 Tax=Blepharisma stoltei TaxID=1481888 RepID=A0AAU9K501_9CILI|nr:unnamed protein product [Blepharisma stoltei]